MKKIFIKLAKLLGYEIIDQNKFSSPTLEKELNDDLSTFGQKSIILPLGEVKITRKINSLLIIVRMNTDIEIWDQNKKRLFEEPKIEYTIRSINSLINSINFCKNKYPNLNIKTLIIDDNSNEKNLKKIIENYFSKINYIKTNKNIILDKNPLNFQWLGFIKILFPNSKIIHCTRNLKDTALSLYKNAFEINSIIWNFFFFKYIYIFNQIF